MVTRKNFLPGIMLFILLIFSTGSISAQSDVWSTAYYAGWMQGQYNNGHLPAQEIDYSAVTHIIHFSLVPNSDGTLNSSSNSITVTNSTELLTRAHNAGKKVIISVGGWNSRTGFLGATNPVNLATFITNLVTFMTTRGYDGIDIDWEPLQSSDATQYIALISALKTALNAIQPTPLLTAAVGGSQANILAQVDQYLDQVNIMTYDMSGAWPGWVTWHNSPIYDGGFVFPSTGNPVPSSNRMVDAFIAAGVPANKIGIGIDFYGYVWSGGSGTSTGGVTEPRQGWSTAPSVTGNVAYYNIMDNYYQPSLYRWDDAPKAAYLKIDNSGSTNDKFISYDNETTVQAKFDYARSKGIGGLIVWELGGGYRPNMPAGQRDLLLQAVKSALNGGGGGQDPIPPTVSITSPTNGSTVSGTINVNANASDNVGVVGVQFKLDGSNLGNEDLTAPYSISWNTTQVTNGSHNLSAVARDAAGNTSSASVTVNVSNTTGGSGNLLVYDDALQSPWLNNSWGATINFNSTEKYYSGSKSIKITTNAWGALSLHYGPWGSQGIDPAQYLSMEFAVFATSSGTKFTIFYENDQGQTFPKATTGTLAVNQWTIVSIPMSQMNPNGQVINRISIQETSGSTKTFYVDEFKFIGTSTPVPPAPILVSPANNATDVPTNPTLTWNASTGATSYRLQVSTSSSFSTPVVDQNGITATSFAVNGLANNTLYYWRVNATNASGTSAWSSVYSFTTSSQTVTTELVLYEESLVSPWINTSWSSTVTFNSTEQKYEGTYSIKVIQNKWGGLRFHSGSWSNPVNVNTSLYSDFGFVVYGGSTGITLGVYFQNDQGQSFPTVSNIQVPANQWKVITIPISQLNPNNRIVHSVAIQNYTNSKRTYYVDNISFIGTSDSLNLAKETAAMEEINPETFELSQNYPNPFNPSTVIRYHLPYDAQVKIDVYNAIGEQIVSLTDGIQTSGTHEITFDGTGLASGVYIYRMTAQPTSGEQASPFIDIKKMILQK